MEKIANAPNVVVQEVRALTVHARRAIAKAVNAVKTVAVRAAPLPRRKKRVEVAAKRSRRAPNRPPIKRQPATWRVAVCEAFDP